MYNLICTHLINAFINLINAIITTYLLPYVHKKWHLHIELNVFIVLSSILLGHLEMLISFIFFR